MSYLSSIAAATFAGASPYNDLQIPSVMASVYLITKGVAFGLWTLFFFAESFRLKVQALRHAIPGSAAPAPRYSEFLLRAVVLFVSLAFLYRWTFLKMISLCDHVAMLISNEQQWAAVMAELSARSDGSITIFHATIPQIIGALAYAALQYVDEVFIVSRFVVLCLLYSIGPIAWAFSISELGAGALRGWFKNTWQVSFWFVVFSVVKAALIPLVIEALSPQSNASPVTPMIYALVILAAMFMIPSLTAAVFSEGNLGAVAGAAMTLVTYSSIRAAAARADSAHRGLFGEDRTKAVAEPLAAGWAAAKNAAAYLRSVGRPEEATAGAEASKPAERTR